MKSIVTAIALVLVSSSFAFAGNTNQQNIYQSLDIKGIRINLDVSAYDEGATVNFWATFEQGVEGRYYQLESASTNFYTLNDNPSLFNFNGYACLRILNLSSTPVLSQGTSENLDLFGLEYSSWARAERQYNYFWNPETDESYRIETNNIELGMGLSLSPALIQKSYFDISTWHSDWDNADYLNINLQAYGSFIGANAETYGAMFTPIPEPATLTLLVIGACNIFIRRRLIKR
jgi:hypothetical protein